MSFVKYRRYYLIFSLSGMALFFGATFWHFGGFARSIAFDGGIRLSVVLPADMSRDGVEAAVKASGLENPLIRQTDVTGNKYDIEFGPDVRDAYQAIVDKANAEDRKKFEEELKNRPVVEGEKRPLFVEKTVAGEIEKVLLPHLKIESDKVVSREVISASYGADLLKTSLKALLYTMLLITAYVSFRFDFSYALGATLALLHDIIFTLGYIGIMQIEPSVPVIAAVLTLIGYSINDTIIIFDRIRGTISDRSDLTSSTILDTAIKGTLSRTILTSFLTMLSIVAILISGAESLKDFASILVFGIIIGTYSSICVASPIVQVYERMRLRRHS
ncbi:protein translocase subunit SecF [Leptonema illini]|uniref:Protein-export membrane protein SecF n=1 Tax=Leptonema illini DSM 21528 TaxID=929563 RepID=H2CB21_9LEPT|nr:protein translocase subunit SecF [Leptonema illini]EHQ08616.1 protein translocase subunit secF [Leptonema illini DSM 21528]